jgi:polyhydroxyalkanoate synthesis regulator phasin
MKNKYSGVWLPKEILNINIKNGNEKILLGAIISLSKKTPCTASNEYFAEQLCLSISQISRMLSNLEQLGYINRTTFNSKRQIIIDSSLLIRINADTQYANTLTSMRKYADTQYANTPINNIEDNININSTTTTKEKLESNSILIDNLCKKYKLEKEYVLNFIKEFIERNKEDQKVWKDDTDLYKHFKSSLAIKLKKQKPKEVVNLTEDFEKNLKWFIDVFNSISKKDYKITETIKKGFKKQFAVGYTGDDFRIAIQNLYSSSHYNKFHIESSFKYATPVYLLKEDNVNKYLNVSYGNKTIARMKRIG